jgi:hypothetical protein
MTPETLAALLLFNATFARLKASHAPDVRAFVAAQPGESGEFWAWTTCVKDSKVFIVQPSERLLSQPDYSIRLGAAHEVCHLAAHPALICNGFWDQLPARRREIEAEMDTCAVKMLAEEAR